MENHRNIFLPFDAINPHMYWLEYYMSHMDSYYKKHYDHDQWKVAKQENCQENVLRNMYCIRWPLWIKYTHLDRSLHPLKNGIELIN